MQVNGAVFLEYLENHSTDLDQTDCSLISQTRSKYFDMNDLDFIPRSQEPFEILGTFFFDQR